MLTLKILIFDGFDELDAIAPLEVLRTAQVMGADLKVDLVTLEEPREIVAEHGLRIWPDGTLSTEESFDTLIVAGGGWASQTSQGVRRELERGRIPSVIAHLHQEGRIIAAICSGALLLAESGLLKGRPAITHPAAIARLKEQGAEIIAARVVDDNEIITSGGVTSGLDLSLWLLERFFSPILANQVEQRLQYERRGTVWRSVPMIAS